MSKEVLKKKSYAVKMRKLNYNLNKYGGYKYEKISRFKKSCKKLL